ncbi:MAG: SPFH domain-containing protein [Enterococcus sp.]|nr:SPFH domain-containing protein [Enterococcus sp.]
MSQPVTSVNTPVQPHQTPLEQSSNSRVIISEKKGFALPGVVAALGIIAAGAFGLVAVVSAVALMDGGGGGMFLIALVSGFLFLALCTSFIIQAPGEATVLEFFGQYLGTVRKNGFSLTLPFMKKRKVLVRTENFETPVSKVNDSDGNPINISAIVVWRLKDTAKATYAVDNYQTYLRTQAEAAVRHVAAEYPYDTNDENADSLLKSAEVVNRKLAEEVAERAEAAGIDIIEVRINNLSYSVEIAQSMLQRQQASAILGARKIIVDGAVGIVEDAVKHLETTHTMDPAKRGKLMADLLVVLVSESKVSPVLDVSGKS